MADRHQKKKKWAVDSGQPINTMTTLFILLASMPMSILGHFSFQLVSTPVVIGHLVTL